MKKKSEALDLFKEFMAKSKHQTGKKLKILCTDGGGEYFSNKFIKYLKSAGIIHEKTNLDTPQENGITECVNRTLVRMAIAMLEGIKSVIGCTAWPYAIHHSTLIKNIIPHSALPNSISPYQCWTSNKPSVATICTFGCNATLAVPEKQCDKLSSCSITGIHLGLAVGKKAFIIFDLKNHKIHKSHNVHFFEGSSDSKQVTIEAPHIKSCSHIVQRDDNVDGSRDGVGGIIVHYMNHLQSPVWEPRAY